MTRTRPTPSLKGDNAVMILSVAFVIAALAVGLFIWTRTATVTATIVGTDRECTTRTDTTSCRYVVYTDAEVFENTDSLLDGKFNSSDVQNQIRQAEGEQVTLRVRGVRLPFFSTYRNIIEVTR